jgi:protein-S-isoprenylcysteine O-methyltransferase Ste14
MYAGMCLLDLGMPLLLNSWFGLTVSGLMIATIFIRTSLEDKTLQAELQSYTDYATRVKYRLVPGIW